MYRLANRYGLTGQVKNTGSGVAIEVQGSQAAFGKFLEALRSEAPPLARITSVSVEEAAFLPETVFAIVSSHSGGHGDTLIAPDAATCVDCLRELFDPADRRYLYPFINCTNCGPRFTILRRVPYDRPNTSMAAFPMCRDCRAEYDDPLSRRFHAQANACWKCGPQLTLMDAKADVVVGDPLDRAIEFLRAGRIVAIKGLGGFHLSVDATNAVAIATLRRRKRRFEKPLAVMVPDLLHAEQFCLVSPEDRATLVSVERAIVLMHARGDSRLPNTIAPGIPDLGIFLPYTPVHHLIFARGNFAALVMTSANLSEEPICIDNDEATARLRGVADLFLVHNRDILLRCDDSVVRSIQGRTTVLRRSRGYVPTPVRLKAELPPVLAVGGELKNAVCMTKGREAFLGQHIGDLENLAAYRSFEESMSHLQDILEWKPTAIAHDLHSGYLSTGWALKQKDVQIVAVQHHHAHVASCMAENHLTGPVIGVVLDGTGYGTDGHVWGGEVLVADFDGFRRAAHLEYVSMPGGAQAVQEPWRMAVAHLHHAGVNRLDAAIPFLEGVSVHQMKVVRRMVECRIRSPLTSSCGRLFDAVAALIGLRTKVNFEAQAAIELEACCSDGIDIDKYRFAIKEDECFEIGTGLLFEQIVDDLKRGVSRETISRRFHQGLTSTLADVVLRISRETGVEQVCLSGGCFLNKPLRVGLEGSLRRRGLSVHTQSQVPCGDGGLSLGQAAIAAHRVLRSGGH
ncbi:carbamoyltransferase HypF [Granulicella sp. 5B5]|uniref:carbamoyltransferase HypF n=1 Tax=Granulicella sp. 5B5 TaxID=1617967 RepID=UPI0021055929|nr:carbamoyltransferase HypF [Granulicella sp. 5B5]